MALSSRPMTGVVGLGQRALAGQRGPEVAARAAAFDQLGLQVTPANVLGIYSVVMEEMTRLKTAVRTFRDTNMQGMPSLGGDPVSPHAARGFNDASTTLLMKCQADLDGLTRVGDGLAEAARAYGKSEEQIKAAFDSGRFLRGDLQ